MKARHTAYLYPAAAVCIWGSLYVVSKPVLGSIPPFTLVLMRYIIALCVLLPLAARICRIQRIRIARADWGTFIFIGVAGYGIATGAQFVGTQLSNASTASLINAMNPVTISVFAALLLGERMTRMRFAAMGSVLLGAFLILGDGLDSGNTAGIIFSMLSVCLWSLMSVRVRALAAKYPPMVITAAALVIAGICLVPVAAAEMYHVGRIPVLNRTLVFPVLYMGLICTALSQLLWNLGLSKLEASRCGMFYPLQPVVSTLLGVWFLHEVITPHFLLGGLFILGGIVCNIFEET